MRALGDEDDSDGTRVVSGKAYVRPSGGTLKKKKVERCTLLSDLSLEKLRKDPGHQTAFLCGKSRRGEKATPRAI